MEHASADSIWQRFHASQLSADCKPSAGQASTDLNASSGQENSSSTEQAAAKTAKTSASEQPVPEAVSVQTPSDDGKTRSLESHISSSSSKESSDHAPDKDTDTSDTDTATEQGASDAGRTPEEGAASSDAGVAEKGPSIHEDTGAVNSAAAVHSAGQGAAHAAGLIKSIAAVVVAGAAVTTGILYNTGKLQAFALKPASPKQEAAAVIADTDSAKDTDDGDAAMTEALTEPAAGEETAADTEVSSDNADTAVTEASAAPTEEETSDTKEETAELSKVTADVDIINGALNTTQSYTPIFDVMSYAEHLNLFLYGGFGNLKERTLTTTHTDSDEVRKEHSTYKFDSTYTDDGSVNPEDEVYVFDETKTVQDANGENTTTLEMEFSQPYTLDNYAPADS